MKYKTPAAFRRALEERLRNQSLSGARPLDRLRKAVAFDRLLARLSRSKRPAWVLKGGFALQLRRAGTARATKDVDFSASGMISREEASGILRLAAAHPMRDWFEFEIGHPARAATGAPGHGLRFPVRCLLDGRLFETFHLDLGFGDPMPDGPEKITGPPLLEFAGIPPTTFFCCPLTSHIAEKLHAYTRTYKSGASTRARDLVDILLIASFARLGGVKLRRAVHATFEARAAQRVPTNLPEPAQILAPSYRNLAKEIGLSWATLDDAGRAAAAFLNPVLQAGVRGKWDPSRWKWV